MVHIQLNTKSRTVLDGNLLTLSPMTYFFLVYIGSVEDGKLTYFYTVDYTYIYEELL